MEITWRAVIDRSPDILQAAAIGEEQGETMIDIDSPDLSHATAERGTTLTIDPSHNGPPHSGHGGVTAGRLAEFVDPARSVVRLHAPIPLGHAMSVTPGLAGEVEAHHGATLVATARPLDAPLSTEAWPSLSSEEFAAVERRWHDEVGRSHPFPSCYGCGPDRLADGLLVGPAPTDHQGVFATRWVVRRDEPMPLWKVWAALDCGSAGPAIAATGTETFVVTGEIAGDIVALPAPGTTCVLVCRTRSRSGRKIVAEAALFGPDREPLATAVTTWILVPARSRALWPASADVGLRA